MESLDKSVGSLEFSMICQSCKLEFDSDQRKPMGLSCGHSICFKCFQDNPQEKFLQCQVIDCLSDINFNRTPNVTQGILDKINEERKDDEVGEFIKVGCKNHLQVRAKFLCDICYHFYCEKCFENGHKLHSRDPQIILSKVSMGRYQDKMLTLIREQIRRFQQMECVQLSFALEISSLRQKKLQVC